MRPTLSRRLRRFAMPTGVACARVAGVPAQAGAASRCDHGNRQSILKARFRVIGIGIDRGVPFSGTPGVTYTTDFGS